MWQLLASPTRFFHSRRNHPIGWKTALAGPLLCTVLQAVAALIVGAKSRPAIEAAVAGRFGRTSLPSEYVMAVVAALGYPMLFGVLTLAMLALNVLVRTPGPADRLTEFTALGFYTQVPHALLAIGIALIWEPEAMRLSSTASMADFLVAIDTYRDTLLSGPLPSTVRLLSVYSLIWLAAVLSIALKVTTRASIGTTVMAAVALLTICAGAPMVGMLLEVTR